MWTFKRIDNKPIDETKISQYEEALNIALNSSVANPCFSNYFVKESIGGLPCGNLEYGLCQALHGEECAIAAFRSINNNEKSGVVIGIIAGDSGNVATPCGNCRDILRQNLRMDLEIVSGSANGGIAIVATMRDYLFETFKDVTIDTSINREIQETIHEGKRLTNDAYSPNIYSERIYFALIVTEKNKFFGAHDIMCDYHPIYALRDAIRQARRTNDPFIKYVIIVSEDAFPDVMYKDRQHLLELNLQAELLTGREQDPVIYLATSKGNVVTTTVKEWLPLPFNPRNFGPEFVNHLTKYYSDKL